MNTYTYSNDLNVCRVCLSSNIKLFDLHKHGLISTFLEFTGTPISPCDGLPQQICTYCCTLLKKSSEFRNKCRNTHSFLLSNLMQYNCLTPSLLQSIDNSHLKIQLTRTKVYLDCVTFIPENLINTIKLENQIDLEQKDPITDFFDEINTNTNDDLDFDVKSEDSLPLETLRNRNLNNFKKKDKITEDKVTNFKEKYISKHMNLNRTIFYEFILKKYINGTVFANATEKNKTENEILSVTDIENIDLSKKLTETTNPNKKQFYEYIIEKYMKNKVEPTEIESAPLKVKKKRQETTDVTRMREKKVKKGARNRTAEELASFAKNYEVTIQVLTTEDQIADVLSRKESEKYKKAQFQCEKCCRGFKVEKAFQNHNAIHDPSAGAFECEVCHARFPKKARLTKHIQMRHKFKFLCKLCNQTTRNSTCAKEHYKCHTGHKYVCEHCGKIFSKYGSRINHIRIIHGSTACDICQERFASEAGLIAHKTKAHRELYKCQTCNVQFHNPDALRKHSESLQGDDVCGAHIRPCTQCGDNFTSEEAVIEHNLEFHNKQKNNHRLQQKLLKLTIEPRPSVRWLARRSPRQESIQDSAVLEEGLKRDVGGGERKKFMCEMCAADGFASAAVLRYHQRIHTGEKPYQCPHCPKRFRISELLRKHIRTHTGDRPYKCAHCPKAFKTASGHYTHQVVHTKIRRHRCHLCDKMFLTSTCVKTHIKSVHMKIPSRPRVRRQNEQFVNDGSEY